MTVSSDVALLGGQVAVAKALGVKRSTVAGWSTWDNLPRCRRAAFRALLPKPEPETLDTTAPGVRGIINRLGGLGALAEAGGWTYASVQRWQHVNRVPASRRKQLAAIARAQGVTLADWEMAGEPPPVAKRFGDIDWTDIDPGRREHVSGGCVLRSRSVWCTHWFAHLPGDPFPVQCAPDEDRAFRVRRDAEIVVERAARPAAEPEPCRHSVTVTRARSGRKHGGLLALQAKNGAAGGDGSIKTIDQEFDHG